MKKIYLDYNATTPLHPEVLEAMLPYFKEKFGNASSIHGFGREAKVALEDAREKVAEIIGVSSSEIFSPAVGLKLIIWLLKEQPLPA